MFADLWMIRWNIALYKSEAIRNNYLNVWTERFALKVPAWFLHSSQDATILKAYMCRTCRQEQDGSGQNLGCLIKLLPDSCIDSTLKGRVFDQWGRMGLFHTCPNSFSGGSGYPAFVSLLMIGSWSMWCNCVLTHPGVHLHITEATWDVPPPEVSKNMIYSCC